MEESIKLNLEESIQEVHQNWLLTKLTVWFDEKGNPIKIKKSINWYLILPCLIIPIVGWILYFFIIIDPVIWIKLISDDKNINQVLSVNSYYKRKRLPIKVITRLFHEKFE